MERRQYDRLPLYIDCILFDRVKGHEYVGKLCDISEGGVGLYIEGTQHPEIHSICTIQFTDTLQQQDFGVIEPVYITNFSSVRNGVRVGGLFCRSVSPQCISYIRMLIARTYLANTSKMQATSV